MKKLLWAFAVLPLGLAGVGCQEYGEGAGLEEGVGAEEGIGEEGVVGGEGLGEGEALEEGVYED